MRSRKWVLPCLLLCGFAAGCAAQPTLLPAQTQPSAGAKDAATDATADDPPNAGAATAGQPAEWVLEEYSVPTGSHPHDVAPASDGTVWYTAQRAEALGQLDPATGETTHIHLGDGAAPHGVIVGPDEAAWVTDGGLNAIVRVDFKSFALTVYPLPADRPRSNLNTAVFGADGRLWFTGQGGVYGWLNPNSGEMELFSAPRGRGPYGISVTPDGQVYYASLAGSYLGQVNMETGEATVLEPPTPNQGGRRVWSDSGGVLWVSEWNAGQLASFDPGSGAWREWVLPGALPKPYAVYIDDQDKVWLSDFGGNALLRFDPVSEQFQVFELPSPGANVRQLLGRPGEVWGAESGTDKLVVVRQH